MDQFGGAFQGKVFLIMPVNIVDRFYDFRLNAFSLQNIRQSRFFRQLRQEHKKLEDRGTQQLACQKSGFPAELLRSLKAAQRLRSLFRRKVQDAGFQLIQKEPCFPFCQKGIKKRSRKVDDITFIIIRTAAFGIMNFKGL